jgi:hypothetical protein
MMKTRYVEMAYDLPRHKNSRFRCCIVQASSPRKAVEMATEELMYAHPRATHVHEFMQRVVTPQMAAKIRKQFDDGTWEGWPFGSEGMDAA